MLSPRILMLALLIGLLVPGAFSHPLDGDSVAAAPLRQADGGNPVELAWVAVRPEDAAEPGYLRDRAESQILINAAASTYVPGPEQDALAAAMAQAGYVHGYFVSMDLPSAEDPKLLRQAVTSTLYQYGDEAGASEGLALLVEAYAARGDMATGEVADVGDEAVVYRSTGNASQGLGGRGESAPFQGVRLLFRSGEFVGNLVLQDFTAEPLLTEVGVMAEAMVNRMTASRAGMAPMLSFAVRRFNPEGLNRLGDQYRRLDGETIPRITPSPVALAAQDEEATRLGVIDRYYYGGTANEGTVVYELQIDRFTDEAAAAAWLDEEPTVGLSFFQAPNFQGLEPVSDAETFGDASTVHAFDVAETDHQGFLLRMRIRDLGIAIAPRVENGLDFADFIQTVSPQADCLQDSDTCDLERTTNDQATREPTQAAEDPVAEPTAEPTQEAAATETYVSPNFGYTLSYDPTEWRVVDGPNSEEGYDFIGLKSGFTTVDIGATSGIPDAQVCVQFMTDDQTSQADVTAFEPLLDETGAPIAGGDSSDAFATTRITRVRDDGGTGDQAFYVRCVVLPSGDAVLIIGQFVTAELYDVAAAQREALLEGLTLP